MRLIDADALIDDLKRDVDIDQDSLDYEELTDSNRENIQFDKDCKQNAIDLLKNAPTIEPEREILDELMAIMKEYYFTHRYEYDEAWENGFAKCMNLIPNVYMKRGKDR